MTRNMEEIPKPEIGTDNDDKKQNQTNEQNDTYMEDGQGCTIM